MSKFLPRESLRIAKLIEKVSRTVPLQMHGVILGFKK